MRLTRCWVIGVAADRTSERGGAGNEDGATVATAVTIINKTDK